MTDALADRAGALLARELAASCAPGVTGALVVDGALVVQTAAGYEDPAGASPLDPGARMYVYSATKPLIAACVLRLAEQGRLELDAPVQRWLPELLELPVTTPLAVWRLLNHTAGLPDYGARPDYNTDLRANPAAPWTAEQFLARTLADGLAYEPGASWAYSNIGYLILRLLLERLHGAPLAEVLARELFVPLGLPGPRVVASLADTAILAPGWSTQLVPDAPPREMTRVYHPGWVSHGVVAATAGELALLLDGVLRGDLLRPASRAAMLEPVVLPFDHPFFRQPAYGLGLMIDAAPARGGVVAGHGGGGPGYSVGVLHVRRPAGPPVTAAAIVNADADDLGMPLAWALARTAADE